ncbi:MAG: GAF domain-containing protein, partial [Chloroflexi bacterium]|nr:GAF domain-containing protein [Chloroflexota bacterium]
DMAHLQLGYEKVAVYLVDPVGGNLALCALAGADRSQIPAVRYHLPLGQGTPGQAALWGHHSRVDDFGVNPESTPALDQATIAELSVPICDAGRAIGALTVASSCPAAYGPQDEEGLALLADQLAALVRAAELFRRDSERAARELLLTYISHAVNSSLSLDQVLAQAVTEVGERLQVDRCVLSRIDLAARVILTEHEYINPMLTERRGLKGRRPLAGALELLARLQQSGQVVISTESRVPPLLRDEWQQLSQRHGVRSLAWIPILGQETDCFYSLNLMQATHPRHWNADDISLLRGIADQLALALRNAQLFDAMQRSAVELRANNAELEAFFYTVSHDLQAPVVSLRGFASLLQSQYESQLDDRGQMYVSRIAANVEFLGQLLQDLLELSRVGRLEEPDEIVAVGNVVNQVTDDLVGPLTNSGARLSRPPLWPEVRYSRTRLAQVFSNLLSNAIRFLGPQPEPRLELGWRRLADRTEFFVKDNGIGIHPDYQQRIFVPFERLKQIEVDGTGVGLSIVKRIVEGRGGTIRLESAPGAGATFYFTIPDPAPVPADEMPDSDSDAASEYGLVSLESEGVPHVG